MNVYCDQIQKGEAVHWEKHNININSFPLKLVYKYLLVSCCAGQLLWYLEMNTGTNLGYRVVKIRVRVRVMVRFCL